MTMANWAEWLDVMLKNDLREILKDAGRIIAELSKRHAETEFEKYRVIQDRLFQSDYDKFLDSDIEALSLPSEDDED